MDAPEATFVLEGGPVLEFQPVVDLADGRLLGIEALVRWDHPTLGLLAPDQLFPWVEANGDIVALSDWVLTEACRQAIAGRPACSWPSTARCAAAPGRRRPAVATALEASGSTPDRLTLEITEGTVADDAAFAELRACRSLGVQLAVDDVGTNWSSFEPLRRLAVNTVKIDDSFVAGLETNQGINRLVVETVIHMAHSLGMATIAEGVETARQVALVREFDADAAQGFFFARPMSPEDATALANADDLRGSRGPSPAPWWTAGPTRPAEEHPAPAAAEPHRDPVPSWPPARCHAERDAGPAPGGGRERRPGRGRGAASTSGA